MIYKNRGFSGLRRFLGGFLIKKTVAGSFDQTLKPDTGISVLQERREGMTDYKTVCAILNDFLCLYYGKKQLSIQGLYKKYGDNSLFLSLMRDMNETPKIPVKKAMMDVYESFKPYRQKNLLDKDWEEILGTARELAEKYGDNRWLKHMILEMLDDLEVDDMEIRKGMMENGGEGKKAA